MFPSPSTKPGYGVCVSIEHLLGQTNWGVCYSENVLIYTHDSLTQLVITRLLIIFPKQLFTGGQHHTLQQQMSWEWVLPLLSLQSTDTELSQVNLHISIRSDIRAGIEVMLLPLSVLKSVWLHVWHGWNVSACNWSLNWSVFHKKKDNTLLMYNQRPWQK